MADLMKATYVSSSLRTKYNDYMVPTVKIKANGTNLVDSLNLTVLEIKVVNSLESAGMCMFKIADAYDSEGHTFLSDVKSKFKLGEKLEIEIGYLSATTSVFTGHIMMVGASFMDLVLLEVTVMDVRRKMMLETKHLFHAEKRKYSQVVTEILGKYSVSSEVDDSEIMLDDPISQNTDDYDFIMNRLIGEGKCNMEFFVQNGKAYFRKQKSEKSSIMTLTYGEELLELNVSYEMIPKKVKVYGYDHINQKALTQDATIIRPMKVTDSGETVECTLDTSADTQRKLKEEADSMAEKISQNSVKGRGVTIGLPEIVIGRYITVKSLESDFADKDFYISEVTHEMNANEFKTTFEIAGCK